MTLVLATIEDAPAIKKLLGETWQDTYGGHLAQATLDETHAKWHSIEFLTKQINNPEIYFLLMKEGDELLGVATARQQNDTISLFRLYVYPHAQHKGIGSTLLDEVIAHFPTAKKVQLHAEEFNQKGLHFYEKHGFKKIRKEQETVINEVVTEILLEKEL